MSDTGSRPPLVPSDIDGITFDFGNTLIEFSPRQLDALDTALAGFLEGRFGPLDHERLRAIRQHDRESPYHGDPPTYRENDLRTMTIDMFEEIYGRTPTSGEVDEIVAFRRRAFVGVMAPWDELREVLERLRARYTLGILSNYPDGGAIREALATLEIDDLFSAVVVSADLGVIKPHPDTFAEIVQRLEIPPARLLHVGDNWLADVQGAKRAGLHAVFLRKWAPPEPERRSDDDVEPDRSVVNLTELAAWLLEEA